MVVPSADPYDEGYPRSSQVDLDPGPELCESLDHADRVASDEHRVVPPGRRLDRSTDLDDADDIDDAESRD